MSCFLQSMPLHRFPAAVLVPKLSLHRQQIEDSFGVSSAVIAILTQWVYLLESEKVKRTVKIKTLRLIF